jgi:ABC-type glutathione transport system ATPase component
MALPVHDRPATAAVRVMMSEVESKVPSPVLTVSGLRKTFAASDDQELSVRALRGVDLSVSRGEFVVVMGPSGCGFRYARRR